ncbi:unnamed protein product [Arctogadus glacialis]
MEDQNLIVAVCSRPVLYDTTMVSYRDRNKKERAWVDVAEDTGFPVDVCRRKWKSLRDRYMREKKREKEGKKCGAGTVKRWKFAGVLSFLDPFVTPRETSSNLPRGAEEVEEDGAPETSLSGAGEDKELEEAAAGPSHNTGEDTYSFCIMATGTTSPAVSQTQRTLMLLLLLPLSLSLPLALPVYLSLRLALPQDHRA